MIYLNNLSNQSSYIVLSLFDVRLVMWEGGYGCLSSVKSLDEPLKKGFNRCFCYCSIGYQIFCFKLVVQQELRGR